MEVQGLTTFVCSIFRADVNRCLQTASKSLEVGFNPSTEQKGNKAYKERYLRRIGRKCPDDKLGKWRHWFYICSIWWTTWVRCYDHNFLRFFPIFGEKIGVFLKYQCYDKLFSKFSFVLSQKTPIFRRKYFKNHNIGPWLCSRKYLERFVDPRSEKNGETWTFRSCFEGVTALRVLMITQMTLSYIITVLILSVCQENFSKISS
jgi:hypothetical protein